MGGAALLLSDHPLPFRAIALESVYPTIELAVRSRLRHYLGIPGGWLTQMLLAQLELRLGVDRSYLRPVEHVGTVGAPVFILSGSADPHPTPAEVVAFYERAKQPKQLWIVPGAAHEDLHATAPAEYETRVGKFLARYLRQGPDPGGWSDNTP
jgi:uncharacterized protein